MRRGDEPARVLLTPLALDPLPLYALDLAARDAPGLLSRVTGALAAGKKTKNYAKFLTFRGLLETDMGIRGEAPTQTAMTVLWRRRDLLTGMVGGRCS